NLNFRIKLRIITCGMLFPARHYIRYFAARHFHTTVDGWIAVLTELLGFPAPFDIFVFEWFAGLWHFVECDLVVPVLDFQQLETVVACDPGIESAGQKYRSGIVVRREKVEREHGMLC